LSEHLFMKIGLSTLNDGYGLKPVEIKPSCFWIHSIIWGLKPQLLCLPLWPLSAELMKLKVFGLLESKSTFKTFCWSFEKFLGFEEKTNANSWNQDFHPDLKYISCCSLDYFLLVSIFFPFRDLWIFIQKWSFRCWSLSRNIIA
jgi:hypothetical protein